MTWRLAKSLTKLRDQVDAAYPKRSKKEDGTIGDTAHSARASDHNPNSVGVVCAMDLTHDPKGGFDSYVFAEMLVTNKDPRLNYVISNSRINSSTVSPWKWRKYSGSNPHDKHVHISVKQSASVYDQTQNWNIDKPGVIVSTEVTGRFTNIVATVFGGVKDKNTSAYDEHVITDAELGVALPARISGVRPQVRVFANGKEVLCDVVDVGPWNTDDTYFMFSDQRPQAETGKDRRGRKTNLAGIDLTPAAAKALGIDGKGKVDFELVYPQAIKKTPIIIVTPTPKAPVQTFSFWTWLLNLLKGTK